MALTFVKHEKLDLRKESEFNEAWLHDRICDDPAILGLGDVRVLDRERPSAPGGRLDLLLFDEDNNRRYEVEIMLGATDPSHIIRTIEYWDIERRRYPAYEHVAVLVAEDITTRFLNVISLMSGSIPIVAIQLDGLKVGESILLNFVRVLDQTDLRTDDLDDDNGGGRTDRPYWNQRAGSALMTLCDDVLSIVNGISKTPYDFNYLRGYIGLRSNGVVDNFVLLSPKPMKKLVRISFRTPAATDWKDRFEADGVPVQQRKKGRFHLTLSPAEFKEHRDLVREAIEATVKENSE